MRPADAALERAHRAAASRVVAALAARFRDLDLAEEAYAEALARAAKTWAGEVPQDAAAWLYRTATRVILDQLRRRDVHRRHAEATQPLLNEHEEQDMLSHDLALPDERLRLIFVCCHPALAEEARVALTLKTVCRLDTAEIARAYLVPEPTLAQRIVRAKRKIAEAGVPFEVPGPSLWSERLSAVLSTVEIAYSLAHADGGGTGPRAEFGPEMLGLARLLAELLPNEPDVLALAATIHFAEARRPARVDAEGVMVPLSEQDPRRWDHVLIRAGDAYLRRGFAIKASSPRLLHAGIHACWCRRKSLEEPPPWPKVLALYDALLALRDDPFVRLNRAVAVTEVHGAPTALREVEQLASPQLNDHLPFHALRADLLARTGQGQAAAAAYRRALAVDPAPSERRYLERRLASVTGESSDPLR